MCFTSAGLPAGINNRTYFIIGYQCRIDLGGDLWLFYTHISWRQFCYHLCSSVQICSKWRSKRLQGTANRLC